jgi:hypothetical protein
VPITDKAGPQAAQKGCLTFITARPRVEGKTSFTFLAGGCETDFLYNNRTLVFLRISPVNGYAMIRFVEPSCRAVDVVKGRNAHLASLVDLLRWMGDHDNDHAVLSRERP